jgi:hypothetical protein
MEGVKFALAAKTYGGAHSASRGNISHNQFSFSNPFRDEVHSHVSGDVSHNQFSFLKYSLHFLCAFVGYAIRKT